MNDRDYSSRMILKSDGSAVQILTFVEWLSSEPKITLPDGFREWDKAYNHFDQANPLGWAVYCFRAEQRGQRAR